MSSKIKQKHVKFVLLARSQIQSVNSVSASNLQQKLNQVNLTRKKAQYNTKNKSHTFQSRKTQTLVQPPQNNK
jgi:hypothetical protein